MVAEQIDGKEEGRSLTIESWCCLPHGKTGLVRRRLGEGTERYEVSVGISEGGGYRSSASLDLF